MVSKGAVDQGTPNHFPRVRMAAQWNVTILSLGHILNAARWQISILGEWEALGNFVHRDRVMSGYNQ